MFSFKNKKRILIFSLLFFLSAFGKAEAATLYVKPPQTEVSVGNIVQVQLSVDTSGKVINNAESIVHFPKDLLEVVSLDKTSSIFSLWVEEPSFSNSIGQATFNGGVPNPGFQGNNGKIISITFRAKRVGTASIIFSDSAVRENDGLGTDILSDQIGSTINIIPVAQPKVDEPVGASIITSKTHPDQAKWYTDNTPEFSWELPQGTFEARTLIGKSASSNPSVSYVPPISKKKVDELPDGTYYFSLQVRTAAGWSAVSRYRVNIDTTPPQPFSITFPHGEKGLEPQPIILFNTVDSGSGVSHYDIKIGSGGPLSINSPVISNLYSLPPQLPGTHTVKVIAFDRAGNVASASADFTIEGIEAPIITYYQAEVESGDSIKIRGTTYSDSDVTFLFKQDEKVIFEEHTRSNDSGDFAFFLGKRVDTGMYTFTARVTDGRGAKSNETKPLTIIVKSKFLTDLTTFILNYFSVAILALLALGGIIGAGIFMWYRLARVIRRLRREAKEAEKVSEKAFRVLRDGVANHVVRLKKANRKLTAEETEFLEQFGQKLEEAEEIITKEIQDISRP